MDFLPPEARTARYDAAGSHAESVAAAERYQETHADGLSGGRLARLAARIRGWLRRKPSPGSWTDQI